MDAIPLTLVTLGALILLGLVAETLGRRTHVPGVTLLLLLGLAIGPVGLDVLPAERERWFPLLAHVALVMIGFLLGGEFTRRSLRERGRTVLVVSLAVTGVTFLVVGGGLLAAGVEPAVALLLGAIATATAPAATVAVVSELKARGEFSRTLLGIVAVDDVWGITLFTLALSAAGALTGVEASGALALGGLLELGGGALLGLVLGFPMAMLTGRLRPGEPTRLEALGFVLSCGGLASWLGVSGLLAAVVMGATVANTARHHARPFRALENIEAPFLMTFFILAGASLELRAAADAGVLAVGYILLRIVGRVLGGGLGSRWARSPPAVGRYMGLALLPQAGVALGMALLVERRFPELASRVLPLVIVATIVFELIGPVATRIALLRADETASST